MFSRVATGIFEGISGADVSSFLGGVKSHFGHQPNAKFLTNGHSRLDFDETVPLVSYLNTIITGQIREEEEIQTEKLQKLQDEEKRYFQEDLKTQHKSVSFQMYILLAFIAFSLLAIAGFCYQPKLIRSD